jgi:pimeloyl-ACP methyl ester carboxylesterase
MAFALACAALSWLSTAAASASPRWTSVGVSFKVLNENTSFVPDLPCVANGRSYEVAGTMFLPDTTPAGVTLYVHGLGFAGYFWNFTAVRGYDYAAREAADGHASVVIDRLGYGSSSIPPGSANCVGSQATILHEVVQDLRDGDYSVSGGGLAPEFERVGLVGHSAGGELAEIEAYSYHDIAALGVMEWADEGYSPATLGAFGVQGAQCLLGGEDQVGSHVSGYAPFGATAGQYDSLMFAGANPAVESDATAMRTRDPCGQIEGTLNGVGVDLLNVEDIHVPIAYVHAGEDAVFTDPLPWAQLQEALYTGSPSVTNIALAGVGHAVTLESSASKLEDAMNAWLTSVHL